MTQAPKPRFGICDAKGVIVSRFHSQFMASKHALSWAAQKGSSVAIKQRGTIIAWARPFGPGEARLDEGHTPELAL
ncbi:hypothetical protein M2305_002213 [Gluconobacter cerinus]|uniref:hypothetical protein n=1 Tax=Gluconobacter cerinus TaxID=38307 RepID=UPI0022275565|nr:hypothetical protein [Gluconobacter cerinus]MCW2266266.1 hypothetical protein [Gluconobacter cerinus]